MALFILVIVSIKYWIIRSSNVSQEQTSAYRLGPIDQTKLNRRSLFGLAAYFCDVMIDECKYTQHPNAGARI